MTTDITIILFNITMKSSVMNIHDFAGSNLIFTMTTGQHVYLINVVHRLICLDISVTIGIFTFFILYYLAKIGFCYCTKAGIDNAFGFLPSVSFHHDVSMDDSKRAEGEFDMYG